MGNTGKLCASVFIIFFLLYWFKLRIRIPKGYKLPPGPPGRLLIGNLLDIPLNKQWETYDRWFRVYGDLTYLNICGTSILFVNSSKLVSELFEQRAGLYSNRVRSIMVNDLAGFDWSFAMMPPNEEWRKHRSIFHQHLGKSSLVAYREIFERLSKNLLHRLYQTPDVYMDHFRHMVGALLLEITYGIKTLPENDPLIELTESGLKLFNDISVPGSYLVDIIPILKHVPAWVPGAGFQKKAQEFKEKLNMVTNVPFDAVKRAMKLGNASPSIVSAFLENSESKKSGTTEEDEKMIRSLGLTIYLAAMDTTVATLQVFLFAMLLYPDVQKKAQEELKNTIGENTLPSLDDRKSLPYIEALIKEVLRWHPVALLAFPHMLKEDDIFEEYFVPKGTIVMGNTWSILHSEAEYGDDVDKFRPERFMKAGIKYPDSAFGYGRRICPGRYMAENVLYIIIANILHAFDISPYETSAGPELPDVDAFVPGLLSHPHPFRCKITSRSPHTKALLEQLSGFE